MAEPGNHSVSMVVLGYNRFTDTTARCLESLSADPDFNDWQLVVVDNGSDPTERDAFVRSRDTYPHMELVRLEQNAGYPGGMNAGLRRATGDFIFPVSSDVLAPSGSVARLVEVMKGHPDAGLVAPVSNAAGNEQQIFISADSSFDEIMCVGEAFADAGGLDVSCLSAYRLDFCFVCLRRSVYDSLGGFDEAFSPGYYEDFDYSLRVRNAGHQVLIAENTFVFHEGGATFGRDSKEKKRLIKRNKKYFLSKHGSRVWMPHVRDANLTILQQYAERIGSAQEPPRLRVENRLALAHGNKPRSFFKRWRYLRRLAAVESRIAPWLKAERASREDQ